jgi:hypothetical protein
MLIKINQTGEFSSKWQKKRREVTFPPPVSPEL